jgi:hypothetical protein
MRRATHLDDSHEGDDRRRGGMKQLPGSDRRRRRRGGSGRLLHERCNGRVGRGACKAEGRG